MKRASSVPLLIHCKERDYEEKAEKAQFQEMAGKDRGMEEKSRGIEDEDEIDDMAEQVTCMTLHKREPIKRGEGELSWEKTVLWRQEVKTRAARLEKQLNARWAFEDIIEDQLNHFHAHYNQAAAPTRLKDVAQKLLMPKGTPAHEMAALAWLGDWRPTAILGLLRSLAHSSSSFPLQSVGIEQAISQLIHEIGIEEAVLDEEMAEIQANCILHLPFGPVRSMKNRAGGPALVHVQSEFKKIHRVIAKAQNLRFRALELAMKKVLHQTDAVEFLVAFLGVQDLIHQCAAEEKLRKGPVLVPVKALGCS